LNKQNNRIERSNETLPEGGKGVNIFDVMQGVSINIFVKKKQ